MPKRNIEQPQRRLAIEWLRLIGGDFCDPEVDAIFLQQAFGEITMRRRDAAFQRFPGDVLLTGRLDILRDQHIDAVRLTIDVIVDP